MKIHLNILIIASFYFIVSCSNTVLEKQQTENLENSSHIDSLKSKKVLKSFFSLNDTTFAVGQNLYTYNISFQIGKSELDTSNLIFLDSLINFLVVHPNIDIDIIVHSDSRTCAHEIKMSRHLFYSRAKSIVDFISRKGINKESLTPKGYDCKYPLISDQEIEKLKSKTAIEEAHRRNRRVEILITKTWTTTGNPT